MASQSVSQRFRPIHRFAGPALTVVIVMRLLPANAGPSNPPLQATPDGRSLTLVFSDDFQTFQRWTGKTGLWRTTFGEGGQEGLDRRSLPNNGELQLYVDPDVRDAKGSL